MFPIQDNTASMPLIFSHSLSSALLSLSPLSLSLNLTVATFFFFKELWVPCSTQMKDRSYTKRNHRAPILFVTLTPLQNLRAADWSCLKLFAGSVVIHSEGFLSYTVFFVVVVIVLEILKNQKLLGHLQVYDS